MVVVNNVRDLAEKSQLAVAESKQLIDDTMTKTDVGSRISMETSKIFEMIVENMDSVVEVTRQIANAGEIQKENMQVIKKNISDISDAIG